MDRYNVTWESPSADSSGSMPLGNGDIGLNVWVERDGVIRFYIGKTDAWDGNVRLIKLGRISLRLSPSLSASDAFRQTLRLAEGEIVIAAGEGLSAATLRLWVDAHHPVIRIEAEGADAFALEATLELWREEGRRIVGTERGGAYGLMAAPRDVVEEGDTVAPGEPDRLTWFHRNRSSAWGETLDLQGLPHWRDRATDPLLDRTFGGTIRGASLARTDLHTVVTSRPARRHRLAIHILSAQSATEDAWLRQLDEQAAAVDAAPWDASHDAHRAWWREFWGRSWLHVGGSDAAETAARGYALQRFMVACTGRGVHPVKFNGATFTVDAREEEEQFNADYRRWGGPYWFQNTRLVYWPMLASGDFDLMLPFFRMYLDALPFAEERTRVYFGHAGAFFPETMYFWGAYANDNYGWDRAGRHVSFVENTFIHTYWSGALELLTMALDYCAYTADDAFFATTLLPLADSILRFYDEHYSRDERGRLVFRPAGALETWHEAVDPLPEIAGLRFVIDGLLADPGALVGDQRRAAWAALRAALPDLPMRRIDGRPALAAAAELIGPIRNAENPELYAIFPYRLYGVGKPDLDMARFTFERRRVRDRGCWHQDDAQAAYLGLAAVARDLVAERLATWHRGSRFPGFWGPNSDWIPDLDHGNVGAMTLQTMLLQHDGRRIYVFPAWPREWDVEFRLHAPGNTAIEGIYRRGTLESLSVAPADRTRDVIGLAPQ